MRNIEELLSSKVKKTRPSGIRKYFDIVSEMKDAISLGVGEPDFVTPWAIREAGIYSLERGNTHYTSNWGLTELRNEISIYLDRRFGLKYNPKDEIMVTVGGSEAIDACIRALIDEGDEVLIPEPSFVCYSPCTILAGGVPVPLVTTQENEFRLTAEAVKNAITPKTKLLVLPYPNNPTGAVMPKEDLEKIADVIKDTDIMVLSDEIYCELTYGMNHCSIASLPGMRDRTVVVNGFSKSHAMTGWRLGYAAGNSVIIRQMIKIHQFAIMSAPTTSQYAAIEALRSCDDEIERMRNEYNYRRRIMVEGFRKMGLECFEPKGAFYVFPCIKSTGMTSAEFCEKLLYSKRVAVIPGDAFGESGEGFIRASYCYSIKNIEEALKRIAEFLKELN